MTLQFILRMTLPLAILVTPELALASESFPPYITQIYRLQRDPACTLCHATVKGGADTVTTKFGKNIQDRGAKGKIVDSLVDALIAAARAGQDSDGDEATDVLELQQGTDPNDERDAPDPSLGAGGAGNFEFGEIPELPPLPAHGCGVRNASNHCGLTSLVLLSALAALRWARQLVRSRRRSERAL